MLTNLRRGAFCVLCLLGCLIACGDDDSSEIMPDAAALIDASSDADTHLDDGSVNESDASDAAIDSGGEPDASDAAIDSGGELSCEERRDAFMDFLVQHQSCVEDDECAVIGDCGPNAVFQPIRADAAEEGYALMKARCSGAFDGPGYIARCDAGMCALEESREHCCGCGDWDGGIDRE